MPHSLFFKKKKLISHYSPISQRSRMHIVGMLIAATIAATAAVTRVLSALGEVVTYNGRSYKEKMAVDQREVLHAHTLLVLTLSCYS